VGVLPAAIVGLLPRRRARPAVIALGAITGGAMLIGALLSDVPVLAVAAIALLAIASALFAARSRLGQVAMTLGLPLVGVGLSYDDVGTAAGAAALIVAGSIYACLVSMAWPERPPDGRPDGTAVVAPTTRLRRPPRRGGRLRRCARILLDLEHVGWACAAALLVMRPAAEMQRLRSVGRILAVAAGALAGVGLVRLDPAVGWYGVAALVAVVCAAATQRSRWYVTSAFTTFLVFLLLLYSDPDAAGSRFDERVVETLLGVGLAYLFALALPSLGRPGATGVRGREPPAGLTGYRARR
jgi:Fusaric acid resistance protein-like